MSTLIFVDRRKLGSGKSLPNRQKLLNRIKTAIKKTRPTDIDADGVKGVGATKGGHINPVKVTRSALAEPTFRYARGTGDVEAVLPGNDRWLRGDEIPQEGGGQGEGSGAGEPGQGDGEDDFVVNISRDEFLDFFFEDCELPDLEQTAQKELPQAELKRTGFQKDGTPGQLSVIRSYRHSLARRKALTADDRAELDELERELEQTKPGTLRFIEIEQRLDELRSKISAVPLFEKVDQRYRKTEKVMVKQAAAVLVLVMDVSGSMEEEHKRIARKFFALQYAFIKRKYPSTDLVFICHTNKPEEVDEEEFFSTRRSGGTVISTAFELVNKILIERYDPTQTNQYVSYCGDGDNWDNDNELLCDLLKSSLLPKLRHLVYSQVGPAQPWGHGPEELWAKLESLDSAKLHQLRVPNVDSIFPEFKRVYGI